MNIIRPEVICVLTFSYEVLAFLYLLLPDVKSLFFPSLSTKFDWSDEVSLSLSIAIFTTWILTICLSILMCVDVVKKDKYKLKFYVAIQMTLFLIHGVLNAFKIERVELNPVSITVFHFLYLWNFDCVILGVLKFGQDLGLKELQFHKSVFLKPKLFGVSLIRLLQIQFISCWFAFPYMIYAVWAIYTLPGVSIRLSQTDGIAVITLLLISSFFLGPNALILFKALKNKSHKLAAQFFWQKFGIWFLVSAFYFALTRIRNETLDSPFPALSNINELLVSAMNTFEHLELIYYITYLNRLRVSENNVQLDQQSRSKVNFKDLEKDAQALLKSVKISKSALKIDKNKIIGEENFGQVWRGILRKRFLRTEEIPVAVKILSNEGREFVDTVISEIKILSLVSHPYLVKFYGAFWIDEDFGNPIGIIMSYCGFGSLESYLKEFRKQPSFINKVTSIELERLEKWSLQIARALEYLGQKQIIHGDVSARNVLLNDQETVQVTDFGMSLRLYEYQLYATNNQTILPWRWLAPEALEDLKFSSSSDVYAYGVTVWEIFTLIEIPWYGFEWSSDFVQKLKNGIRLDKPALASEKIYKMLCRTWDVKVATRISFPEIVQELSHMTSSNVYVL